MKKTILFVTIIALVCSLFPSISVFANGNEINIAVDEPFYDLDIFSITDNSSSVDQIFTMVYDRLFRFSNGTLVPDIASSCTLVPSDDPDPDEPTRDIDFEIPELPFEWIEGYGYLPGMLDHYTDLDDLEFLTGTGSGILRFSIRNNVRFSDDTPLTAVDIAAFINLAKLQPHDTLIYKQWEAVAATATPDDYTLDLYMRFSDKSYGYIDFMYSLTTPIASIVKQEEDNVVGTGAYSISTLVEDSVTLERRNNWWQGTLSTGVDYVTFSYFEDMVPTNDLAVGVIQVVVADGNTFNTDGIASLPETRIPTNPIAMFINKDDPTLSLDYVRQFFFRAIDANTLVNSSIGLVGASHDYWSIDNHNHIGFDYDDYIKNTLQTYGWDPIEDISFTITSPNVSIMTQTAALVQDQCNISGTESNSKIKTTIEVTTEAECESLYNSGNYQLILKEIELSDIDSAYRYLYGKSTENMDNLLYAMKCSANLHTFQVMHGYIQAERVNDGNALVLGWKYKSLLTTNGITGYSIANKYNPISLVSYIDFRGIDFE